MIPKQLENEKIEFILLKGIRGKEKPKPLHKWRRGEYKRFKYNDKILVNHLKRGGNYAVFCGNGLIVIDADSEELKEAVKRLPKTFTVLTGGNGLHHYYWSDLDKKIVLFKDGKHIGEIQAGGMAYVIGPNSNHPSGRKYVVYANEPIAYVSREEIERWIKSSGFSVSKRETKEEVLRRVKQEKTGDMSPYYQIPITDICLPDNQKTSGDEIYGAHPVHGSKTERNFWMNIKENCFYCFRCNAGGGPLDLIAVVEGIIDCSEAGAMSDEAFIEAVITAHKKYGAKGNLPARVIKSVALREGYCTEKEVDEWKVPAEAYIKVLQWFRERGVDVSNLHERKKTRHLSLANRIKVEAMPEKLPDADVICIIKPPRVGEKGGTHYAIKQLVKAGGGTYVTHRHEGVRHALSILKKLDPEPRTVVWLEGKHREGMCKTGNYNCKSCLMYPDEHNEEHIGYFELERIAEKLLLRYKVLTKDVVNSIKPWEVKSLNCGDYEGPLCPYYTLMAAVRSTECKYCFTVAHFIDRGFIKPKLIVIDESQTIQHFYPRSVELAEVILDEEDWHARSTLAKEYMPRLKKIKERIEAKIKPGKDGRIVIRKEDKVILEIIRQFETLNSVLKMGEAKKLIRSDLSEFIPKVNLEEYDTDIESVLDKLTNYVHPDEYDPTAMFEAVLIPFRKHLCWVKSDNNKRYNLYLIGDAEKPQLRLQNILSAEKLIIIGGIEAERFAKWLGEVDKQVLVYEITEFPFKNNYLIFGVNGRREEIRNKDKKPTEWEKRRQRRRNLKRVIDGVTKLNIPLLVWTGSKRKQHSIEEKFPRLAKVLREESVEDIKKLSFVCNPLIGYANSRIARAVDIPFIDVCAIWDADFVSPYWYAVIEDAKERKDEETKSLAEFIHQEIVAEETTNMALRISPTPDDILNQPKIVLIPQDELGKIRYISDRIVNRQNGMKPESIVNMIDMVIRRRIVFKLSESTTRDIKKSDKVMYRGKEAESIEELHYVAVLRIADASLWEKHTANGLLLTCLVKADIKEGTEIPGGVLSVVRDNIIHVLGSSKTRINQNRLVEKVKRISPLKDERKLREIIKKLVDKRVVRVKKVGNKLMYSLWSVG